MNCRDGTRHTHTRIKYRFKYSNSNSNSNKVYDGDTYSNTVLRTYGPIPNLESPGATVFLALICPSFCSCLLFQKDLWLASPHFETA